MYRTRIVHRIDEISQPKWDQLNTGQPFSQYRWLQFGEKCLQPFNPLIVLLYEDDKLVGRAIYTIEPRLTSVPLSSTGTRFVDLLLRRYPLLLCQTPIANKVGLLLPDGGEARGLQAIEQAVRREFASRKASFFLFGYLTAREQRLIQQTCHYSVQAMDPTTFLPIAWGSFDEYLASLGKSARKDFHQHTNHARKANITIERCHQAAPYTDQLWQLMSNVAARHGGVSQIPYTRDIYVEAERQLSDTSVILLARAGSTLAGCGLLLHDQGHMILMGLGLDYDFKYIYFQLFYEAIRYAIEKKVQLIRGGSGAYPFKQRLGFQTEPTFVAFSSPNIIFRGLARIISGSMSRPDEQVQDSG